MAPGVNFFFHRNFLSFIILTVLVVLLPLTGWLHFKDGPGWQMIKEVDGVKSGDRSQGKRWEGAVGGGRRTHSKDN